MDLQTNPQAAPDTALPETPADEVATSEVNTWADFADDTDDDVAGTVEGEFEVSDSDAAPETIEATPETQPAVQEPVAPVAAEPPPQATPEPVAPAPEPQPQPTQPVQTYADWRTQQEGNLEKHYALDEDTARALLSEPETVLPKLAARVHLEVTENVLRAVQNMVPGILEQYQSTKAAESTAESAFYAANEDLRSVPKDKILQIGAMFRQVNPNATPDQAVTVIGDMVRAALGMSKASPAVPPPPETPRVQPYTPVRGSGGAAERVVQQTNPWADLLGDD